MMKQKYTLFYFLLAFAFVGCSNSVEDISTSLSGEVVNPRTPYIIILKDGSVLDTVSIDSKNHFYYQFPTNIKPGLYTLRHNYGHLYQTQMFYIEPGDSLLLRVNTREFDESLMYSGKGAKANNFLMEVFLNFYTNDHMFLHYYKIAPQSFVYKIDSIKNSHQTQLQQLVAQQKVSNRFEKLAEEIINYGNYDMRERYYFLVNKYYQKFKKALPANFLSYRKNVDYNHKTLQSYYIYQAFLNDYLRNKSVERCLATTHAGRDCYNTNSVANLNNRLFIADSLFTLPILRSRFMPRLGIKLIVRSQTSARVDSLINILKTIHNPVKFTKIKEIARIQKEHFIGNIGQLNLYAPTRRKVEAYSLLTGPTVFFYWSNRNEALQQYEHKKIDQLRKRYPQINFIGINIDKNPEKWLHNLKDFNYDPTTEYRLDCLPEQREFYTVYLRRLFFVDRRGAIKGNLFLHDRHLEEKLLAILNQ